MLAINNYLVIGVNPANTETGVAVDTQIKITFSKHMDQTTLTPSTLILKKTNGGIVEYSMTYNSSTMTTLLTPKNELEPGSEYQLEIVGTSAGIKSITGDYMSVSRTYEFTTAYGVSLSAPTNLVVSVENGYPTLTWSRPADYDTSKVLTYEIQISTSNDPLITPIWPSTGDINQTNATTLNVPKKLAEGNYYAHIRVLDGETESEWASIQFVVEPPATVPSPGGPPNGGGGDIFSFNVVETYPRRNDVDVTPEKIIIVFGDNINPDTVTEDTIYIVKKPDKDHLSFVDFMTEYAPSKKVSATIEPMTTPNIVVLTSTLEDDAEYTVIVRETVQSTNGAKLGMAYHWSFMTKFSRLYGDAEMIRSDLGPMAARLSNKTLYKAMRDNSIHAYNIVSQTANFNPADYEGGKAPYYVHQYVRYRTSYDLLLNGQIQETSGSGSAIQLGDLRVDKKTSSSQQQLSLRDFKERIKPWEDAMHGYNNRGYAKPSVVVRGENVESYPDFLTRTEFRELGQ